MRVRTIKGSPERSASATWDEIARMVQETLVPAASIDDDDVSVALGHLAGVGRTLIATGVLADEPVVLTAPPLHVEIYVSLGNDALKGEERLGKVPGAGTASEWKLYVPDPVPYSAQVASAVAQHDALYAGAAPTPVVGAAATQTAVSVDADALRRISGSHHS